MRRGKTTDAPVPAILKETGMQKCGTKPKAAQRDVGRSGVTTAGKGGESDPQNVNREVRHLNGPAWKQPAGSWPACTYSLLRVRGSMCD